MFSCFLILLAFLAFISKPVHSQYTLTPFAGTGTQGNNGDNGQATSANVNFIANTWVDTNGVTFVVDYSANVIRQVAVDGIITTIGGTGTAAISNSGGAFTSVALYSPWGVNGDSTYLYFSDNYHVWKYTRATGIVAILAGTGTQGTTGDGGPGASAQINKANGLWMNSDNCLYIAEYGNNLLRKIDLATTVISTVAGGGGSGIGGDGGPAVSTNTKLNAPQGVYIDTNGVIFIADRNNARVRYIVNGIINTYAGGGPSSNTADGFVGTDAYFSSPFDVKGDTMGNIFAVEGANKVKVVDYATKVVTTYLSTGLNAPRGIWLDYLNGRSIISMLGYAKTAPLYVNPVPSESPTAMPTFIATASPSAIPTVTPSAAPSAVPTFTPSATPSAAPTFVPTVTPTFVPSAVPTATPSASPSATPTAAPTALPSSQPSSRPSGQPSTAPSAQPSSHPSSQPSSHPTGQPSSSPSSQPSSQPSAQPSRQPTSSPSSQPSSHPSSQPSTNPSSQPTSSPSSQPSTHPSGQPSAQPSNCPSSQPSSSPSAQPSSHPSSQPSSHPSSQPSSSPSSQPSAQPSSQPSAQPSNRPSGQPSSSPSAQPSSHPSSQPSSHPSSQPSSSPSSQPSAQPSSQPSAQPSSRPSSQPSSQPSAQPSTRPSSQPSSVPSSQPSAQPTSQPTTSSSSKPTGAPSSQPSSRPSSQPSAQPSSQPSGQPSSAPSAQPSSQPSSIPSSQPSSIPTSQPSVQPSSQPTSLPTSQPTMSPTAPTFKPTRAPSFSPTVKNDDVVKVSGTSRVRFVNGETLNDLSLATILTAFQNISDNAQSTVITSAVLVNASTTQSQSNTASGRNMRRGLGASVSGQAVSNKPSYTYDIGFLSTYVMTFHPTYASASQLAASKTTTIRQAIEVGQFESALRFLAVANNATQLLNSSSTEVKSIDSVVVPASSTSSSSNNDDGLSAGTVAGIVIGILGGCLVLGIVLYVVLKRYDDEKKRREEMNVERKNSDHFTAL